MASKKPPEISAEIRQAVFRWLDTDPADREPNSERQLARRLGVHRSLIWYVKQEWKLLTRPADRESSPWEGSPLATYQGQSKPAQTTPPPGGGPLQHNRMSVYAKPRTLQEWKNLRERGGRRVLFSVKVG